MRLPSLGAGAALAVLLMTPPTAFAAEDAGQPEIVAPTVSVVTAAEHELVGTVLVTGTLAARDEVLVGPEIDGSRVVELLGEEGDEVEKGQVLARLSRDLWDAQLASVDAALARSQVSVSVARSQIGEASAAAAQADADFERAKALIQRHNTSVAILDEREAAAKTAKARLATAEQSVRLAEAQVAEAEAKRKEIQVQLGMTEIKAPAAGRISERKARLGALAMMNGDPLFRIIEDDRIELHAQVAEIVLPDLAAGQPAQVTPVGSAETIAGTIRLISPRIDPQTRLATVKIGLDESAGLTLGTFARGRVETGRETGVVVPITAIQFESDRQQVQVVADGKVETRTVRLGLRTNDAAVIEQGLEAGEKIVAVSGSFLRDGDQVRPVDAAAPALNGDRGPQLSATY